jgi:hypothetical protein
MIFAQTSTPLALHCLIDVWVCRKKRTSALGLYEVMVLEVDGNGVVVTLIKSAFSPAELG